MNHDPTIRRPLKSRGTVWAHYFSRLLLKAGLTPNVVSLLSMACAAMAAAATWWAGRSEFSWMFWFVAAAGIQLRLFCNLMDGLLAVEGGLKSATGELFNELPDRVADVLILVPLGYAEGSALGIALGWAAGCGSVFTAYIRALGASQTRKQDFRGPMAKPHRMAAATIGCLGMMGLDLAGIEWPLLFWCLIVINTGIFLTSWRRIRHLALTLKQSSPL